MKRTILFTHGELCLGFKSAMNVIGAEEPKELYCLSMRPGEAPETAEGELKGILSKFDENDTKIVLTDIPYGSTTHVAIPMLENYKNLFIVSGVTLGLLMGVLMEDIDNDSAMESLDNLCNQSKETVVFMNKLME